MKGDTAQISPSSQTSNLFNSKMLIMIGEDDSVVRTDEVSAEPLGRGFS